MVAGRSPIPADTDAVRPRKPRRRTRVLSSALLALLAATALAVAAPGALALGPAFDPATPSVFIAHDGPTQLSEAVQANGQLTFANVGPTAAVTYNAISYDTENNYLYALQTGSPNAGEIIQIGSDGIPSDTGVNLGTSTAIGGWNPANDMVYFVVTVAGGQALQPYDPATNSLGTQIPMSQRMAGIDITYSKGYFWSWGTIPGTGGGPSNMAIGRIDPATGTVTNVPVPPSLFPGCTGCSSGAAFTYGNGNIAFDENATGNIYQVSITNPSAAQPTFEHLSTLKGFVSTNIDASASPGLPTDLVMHKTASSQVPDGGKLTYTLTVSNNGPGNSSGYTISDKLPAGLSNPQTTTPGCSIAAGVLACSGNPLNKGATSPPITVTGTVPDPFTTPITNSATVTGNEDDPDPGNDTSTVTTKPSADLSIAKSASSSPAVPGKSETYTLTVVNGGPDTALNAVASDPLPSGLTFVSASQGCAFASGTVTCDAGDLAPGASKAFKVTTKVGSAATGRLANTATVHSDTPDPNPPNNTTTTTTTLTPQADLSIAKTASTSPVVPGENEKYTLKVTNDGPSTATNVRASDALPKGLAFVSASQGCTQGNGTVTCAAGTLDPGASKSFTITAKVASSIKHAVDNTATVTSDTPDPDGGNNKTTTHTPINARADLSITKTPSLSTVGAGGQVLYTLVVKNKGPSDATRVKVTDDAPAGLTLVSAKASQGKCKIADGTLSCMLFKIQKGGSAQVLVTATTDPAASGELSNRASVTGDQDDPDPDDNNDTGKITVTPSPPAPAQPTADLQIRKRVNHHKVTVGQRLRYTIEVTNNGPAAATGVKVADTISRRVRIRSVKADQGNCKKGNPLSCTLGTIASGDTVTIRVVVVPRQKGGLRNAASVTGEGLDPKTANNLVAVKAKVARKPKLRVSKKVSHRKVEAGQRLTYRIRVRNPSRRAVRRVRVCDRLPSGLTLVRASHKRHVKSHQRRICWRAKRIRGHRSKTYKVVVRVGRHAKGRKVNRATAKSPNARTGRAKRAVRVVRAPRPKRPSPPHFTG